MNLLEEVIDTIVANDGAYTRSMYVRISIKKRMGMSLNKFRKYLENLESQGYIKSSYVGSYKLWLVDK